MANRDGSATQSGTFKHLLAEHGEVFALVKQLGVRSDQQVRSELERRVREEARPHGRGEISGVYAALREIVQTEQLASENDTDPSDLADALAALDAINPGSPEWGPAFLQVSELVEAHVNDDQSDASPKSDEPDLLAAC